MRIILNSSGQRVDCAIACRVFLAMFQAEYIAGDHADLVQCKLGLKQKKITKCLSYEPSYKS